MTYNMWSKELQTLLKLTTHPINPLDVLTEEEIAKTIKEVIFEEAWKLMAIYNMSMGEALLVVTSALRQGAKQ